MTQTIGDPSTVGFIFEQGPGPFEMDSRKAKHALDTVPVRHLIVI